MPSKYAKLKGKLDPWQPEPSYQEKVDAAKGAYIGLSPTELAQQFKAEDDKKDICELAVKACDLELAALSQLIVSALQGSGQESFTLESGMKVGLDMRPVFTLIKTPEAASARSRWERSPNMKPLLTLNAKTREGFCKEAVMKAYAAGMPLPKWLTAWANVTLMTRAKLYGKKKENSNGGNEDE